MRLVREAVGENSKFKGNRHLFRIVGKESDAELIAAIDLAIGKELTGNKMLSERTNTYIDETYHLGCSDWCADYICGTGCGWYIEIENVDEFKSLWKKYKTQICKKDK